MPACGSMIASNYHVALQTYTFVLVTQLLLQRRDFNLLLVAKGVKV